MKKMIILAAVMMSIGVSAWAEEAKSPNAAATHPAKAQDSATSESDAKNTDQSDGRKERWAEIRGNRIHMTGDHYTPKSSAPPPRKEGTTATVSK